MTATTRPHLYRGDEGGPLSRRLTNVRLVRLVDFMQRGSGLAFRRISGLSDFECRVLARVCETPPLSINELGGLLGRGVAQVSRAVKRLVQAGLVRRENRGGGPGVSISPTPLGLEVYQPLVAAAEAANAGLLDGLSAEDLDRLDRCIARMTDNALERLALEQGLQAAEPPDDA